MLVDIEVRAVSVEFLAHVVGQRTDGIEVCALVELDAFLKAQPLASSDFVSDGFEAAAANEVQELVRP